MRPSSRTLTGILIALNAILLIVLALQIGERFLYELSGAFNGDSPIYWAVGRGLVNGLTLYKDIFDIKPPGIFLLSALSFATTDTMSVGHLVQGLVLALLPLTILVPLFLLYRQRPARTLLFILLIGLAFMGSLTMYVAFHGGEFQTESFGIFFVCAYIGTAMLLRASPRPPEADTPLPHGGGRGKKITLGVLAGFFFFGGILFKEPFLIGGIVAGLLLCRTRRDILWVVLLPCAIGLALLGLTLLGMGALDDYVTIYLPFLTGNRTHRFGSPFSRAMLIEAVAFNVWDFSPFLALGIGTVLLYIFIERAEINVRSPRMLLHGALLLTGLVLLNYGLQTERLFPWQIGRWFMQQSPFWIIVGLVVTVYAWQGLFRSSGRSLSALARTAVIFLAVASIGYLSGLSGEFLGHHMLFAAPIYVALVVMFLDILATDDDIHGLPALVAVLFVLAVFFHAKTDYAKNKQAWMKDSVADRVLAEQIDTLLDACDVDQYLIVGETGVNVFGYTKHSPLGPIFFQQSLISSYPPFTLTFIDQLQKAEVILTPVTWERTPIAGLSDYVEHDFSLTTPSCAAGFSQPSDSLALMFRVKKSEIVLNVDQEGKPSIAFTPEAAASPR